MTHIVAGYRFEAAQEQFRPPQITRIALLQHSISKPTTAPFAEQRAAIHARVTQMLVRSPRYRSACAGDPAAWQKLC